MFLIECIIVTMSLLCTYLNNLYNSNVILTKYKTIYKYILHYLLSNSLIQN